MKLCYRDDTKLQTNNQVETLRKCLVEIKARKMYMSKAPRKYSVPYGTMRNKINNFRPKKHGGQTSLSQELEEVLVKSLDQLTDSKVSFDGYDIQCLVQSYFNTYGQHRSRFRDDMPGPNWVRAFIKRHKLTKYVTGNVKAARAEVTREVLMDYFNDLEKWVNVSFDRIYNYDETNVTDNPGAKAVIADVGVTELNEKQTILKHRLV